MMDIFLIRHTLPAISLDTCYGRTDLDVADSFGEESLAVKARLAPAPDMVFFSSPLKRCRLLAQSLTSGPLEFDDRLLEFDFGELELRKWHDLEQTFLIDWMSDFVNQAAPGGESFKDLDHRCQSFFDNLLAREHPKTVVVTHSGVIRVLVARVLGLPLANIFNMHLDFGSITKITHLNGHLKLMFLNRT